MAPAKRARFGRRSASAQRMASFRSRETALEARIRVERQRIRQSQLRCREIIIFIYYELILTYFFLIPLIMPNLVNFLILLFTYFNVICCYILAAVISDPM